MLRIVMLVLVLVVGADASTAVDREQGSEVRGKRSDDGGPLEVVVQQLTQQNNAFSAELSALKAEIATLKAKTSTLDTAVAFHSWGSTNPVQTIAQGTLILDHVTTNIGNAYDLGTGVFTAPFSGLYAFHATIMEVTLSGAVHAGIFVDGELRSRALCDNSYSRNYHQSPLMVVTHLSVGSKVVLKNTDGSPATYYSSPSEPYTTFSGFLIKAD